jgi:hypothetical protein
MRTNYINEIDVRIQGTLILFNNDMSKVEPADFFQKLVPFSLPSKFVRLLFGFLLMHEKIQS